MKDNVNDSRCFLSAGKAINRFLPACTFMLLLWSLLIPGPMKRPSPRSPRSRRWRGRSHQWQRSRRSRSRRQRCSCQTCGGRPGRDFGDCRGAGQGEGGPMLLVTELPSGGHHPACPGTMIEENSFSLHQKAHCFQIFRNFAQFQEIRFDKQFCRKSLYELFCNKVSQ